MRKEGFSVYGRLICRACGKIWTGVAPENCPIERLQCPSCFTQGQTDVYEEEVEYLHDAANSGGDLA